MIVYSGLEKEYDRLKPLKYCPDRELARDDRREGMAQGLDPIVRPTYFVIQSSLQREERTDKQIDGRTDRWTDGEMDGQKYERTDGWAEGQMGGRKYLLGEPLIEKRKDD